MVSVDAFIAANRFGLGARPGELSAINGDLRGWLRAQIRAAPEIPEELQSLEPSNKTLNSPLIKWLFPALTPR